MPPTTLPSGNRLARESFRLTDRTAPAPTTTSTASPSQQVHLLIRYATDPSEADEVVAALTDHAQATALLAVYEDLEAAASGYDIVGVPVHTTAAAALGL